MFCNYKPDINTKLNWVKSQTGVTDYWEQIVFYDCYQQITGYKQTKDLVNKKSKTVHESG